MKYLQDGGFQNQPLMRLTLSLALLLLIGFWFTNLALYFSKMTLDPASVIWKVTNIATLSQAKPGCQKRVIHPAASDSSAEPNAVMTSATFAP